MMRFCARALMDKGLQPDNIRISLERNMQCGIGMCGPLPARPVLALPGRPGHHLLRGRPPAAFGARAMSPDTRPSVAVWKFASCDGCQLSLLDLEEELLKLVGAVRISYFLEMSRAS